jgi:hypothetical protein
MAGGDSCTGSRSKMVERDGRMGCWASTVGAATGVGGGGDPSLSAQE